MNCPECSFENIESARFCGKCGARLVISEKSSYMQHIKSVGVFFSVLMVFIVVLEVFELQTNYRSVILLDGVFIFIVFVFFIIGFKDIKSSLFPKTINFRLLIGIIVSAFIFSVPVTYLADYINNRLFPSFEVSYYHIFLDSPSPFLFAVFSVAFVPAVFEEIAFRGLIFNDLLKVTTGASTVIISAILFSFIHFSLIALIWIFPIGLFFGWLRLKYNTLLYGIVGHFFYNFSIMFLEKYSLL